MTCRKMMLTSAVIGLAVAVATGVAFAQAPAAIPAPAGAGPAVAATVPAPKQAAKPDLFPKPTLADVPYGTHPKQVLDFYKAESATPTPVVFWMHGGSWLAGDKVPFSTPWYLKHGLSVVSIQYRFVSDAAQSGVKPPVEWPMHDAARALQFVRSKAKEWNIDKTRIGVYGISAGACSCLWLAFHDDMADPNSSDPVARESTRPTCAAAVEAQTTLDPRQMREWIPNSTYGGHAFGFAANSQTGKTEFQEFLEGREKILPWIKEYSPYELVRRDAPPIFLYYSAPPAMGRAEKDPTHSANFGVNLQEKCRSVGVECRLACPGTKDLKYGNTVDFLLAKLKTEQKE